MSHTVLVGSHDQTVAAIIHMVTGGAAVAVGVSWTISVLAIGSQRWSSSTGSEMAMARDCLDPGEKPQYRCFQHEVFLPKTRRERRKSSQEDAHLQGGSRADDLFAFQ